MKSHLIKQTKVSVYSLDFYCEKLLKVKNLLITFQGRGCGLKKNNNATLFNCSVFPYLKNTRLFIKSSLLIVILSDTFCFLPSDEIFEFKTYDQFN